MVTFAEHIQKDGLPIEKLIIFGSYAKGTAHEHSDIDLCIISPKFGKDAIRKLQYLLKQSRYIDNDIEPFPLSIKEYKNGISPLIAEIKKFGKIIRF